MAWIDLANKSSRWLLFTFVLTLALSSSMQDSRTAEAGGGFMLIFKTGPDAATPLPDSCFNVFDSGQSFLFEVCDNDFQGPPQSHPACVPDGVCEEQDAQEGTIDVTIAFADDYQVVESKAPPGFVADPTKKVCPSFCKLLFINQPAPVGGVAKLPDVARTGGLQRPAGSGNSVALPVALAGAALGAIFLGGASWIVRRRWSR